MIIRRIGAVFTVLLVIFSLATPAGAHSSVDSYLYLDVSDEALGGRVEMPIPDLDSVVGLELEGDGEELLSQIIEQRAAVEAYLREHVHIATGDKVWELEFTEVALLENNEPADGNYVLFHFIADVSGEPPREFDIEFDPFFDELDDRGGLVLIGNDLGGGVLDNDEEWLAAFTPDERTNYIDLGSSSQWSNFTVSVRAGLDHIRSGPDHVLFVLVLLLPSVLVFRGSWEPASGFRGALWRILKIVTMFTIAHSITFVLAGIDALPLPPSRLVETVIAASIAAAALHNLRPIAPNREPVIAFVFGLVHGMGFASLVAELDVSTTTQLISLLGRNIGIEIGQAIVVLITFPALFALRRTPIYRPVFIAGSLLLTVVALGWMIERLFDQHLRINDAVELVTQWPRSLGLAAILTVAAVTTEAFYRRRSELISTASGMPR
jgi:hypothetical protein